VLAVISKKSIESEWVRRELGAALVREFSEKKVVVLPLLLDYCQLPPFLLDKRYVDFRQQHHEKLFGVAVGQVLRVLLPSKHQSLLQEEIETPSGRINVAVLVHQIAERLGFADLSFEQKQALLDKMGEALIKRLFLEMMEHLGDEGVVEYEKLLDCNASPEEVQRFLDAKIRNFDALVRKVGADFEYEMTKEL